LDNPQKLRKLRVEALIFTGGMNKNYIGKLRKLRVEALIFTGGMNKNYIGYSLQVEEVEGFSRER